MKQTGGKRVPGADNQLQRFCRLDESDDPPEHTEHARFRAARRGAGRWRFREQAAVTRPSEMRRENARLAFETKNRAIDIWLAREDTNVVRKIASWEIIGAVNHNVVVRDDLDRVRARQACFV